MDPSSTSFLPDQLDKCPNLTMEERIEIVDELHQCAKKSDLRELWSRQDLLDLMCQETGQRRKHTSFSKMKLIELLIRIMSNKISEGPVEEGVEQRPLLPPPPAPPITQSASKRRRKSGRPSRLPNHQSLDGTRYCQNSACRSALGIEDSFCRRCSCCICRNFNENKDPSLWLVCGSEGPTRAGLCGMSYHLECVLNQERADTATNGQWMKHEGSFYCMQCGRKNDLLSCWRKQLMIAKDTRRVGDLCHRVHLSHRILSSVEKYTSLHQIVDGVRKKLEAEVGSLNNLPLNMSRGLVNRLLVGAEVQKMCAHALESLDSTRSSFGQLPFKSELFQRACSINAASIVRFEGVSPTSLTVVLGSEDLASSSQKLLVYSLWHSKAHGGCYPKKPTHTLCGSQARVLVSELSPATEYMFRTIAYSCMRLLGIWETKVTTASSSMTQDVAKDFQQINISSLTNPSSPLSEERGDSNRKTAFQDLNELPDGCFGYTGRPVIDLEKPADGFCEEEQTMIDGKSQDENPWNSVSVLTSRIQLDSSRDSTEKKQKQKQEVVDFSKLEKQSSFSIGNEVSVVPFIRSESSFPVNPSRLETSKDGSEQRRTGINIGSMRPEKEAVTGESSKTRAAGYKEPSVRDGSVEGDYEFCVKVVRWLEHEGHMEANFRTKFLTWFSMRASHHERKIVKVFVDTLADDPASLAAQLVDTFSDSVVCQKSPTSEPKGLCLKLRY